MKRRRHQVTCWCGRYDFPHRLGGGKCHGREWCMSYYEYERDGCRDCTSNAGYECDVALGSERLAFLDRATGRLRLYCQGMKDHLHYGAGQRHPVYEERADDDL